jgi:hypothetical protein
MNTVMAGHGHLYLVPALPEAKNVARMLDSARTTLAMRSRRGPSLLLKDVTSIAFS